MRLKSVKSRSLTLSKVEKNLVEKKLGDNNLVVKKLVEKNLEKKKLIEKNLVEKILVRIGPTQQEHAG